MALLFADGLVDRLFWWKFDIASEVQTSIGQMVASRHAGDAHKPFNSSTSSSARRLGKFVDTSTVALGVAQRSSGNSPGTARINILQVRRGGSILVSLARIDQELHLFEGAYTVDGEVWSSAKLVESGTEWVPMSMRVHIDGVNSTVRVWHGNLFLTEQTLDLGSGNIDEVSLGHQQNTSFGNTSFQDFWVTDGEPLFDARIVSLLPDSAGADSDWDPDTETDNFQEVNNHPGDPFPETLDGFSGIVTTEGFDQRDSYGFENLPTDEDRPRVAGVYVNALARKTDEATRKLRVSTRIDTTYFDGPEVELTDGNLVRQELLVNPDTTAEWAKSEIDAAEFGFQSRA